MLRYELKYLFPESMLPTLRNHIAMYMECDSWAQAAGGHYTVRSVYFDTPQLKCYFDKVEGIKRRFKIRVRTYAGVSSSSQPMFFLEKKEKYLNPMQKLRVPLTHEQLHALWHYRQLPSTPSDALKQMCFDLWYYNMKPTVATVYERRPWLLPKALDPKGNGLRVTFDMNLRAVWDPDLFRPEWDGTTYPVMPGWFVLEVKYNKYCPVWLRELLMLAEGVPRSVSKYCLCMDTCFANGRRVTHVH